MEFWKFFCFSLSLKSHFYDEKVIEKKKKNTVTVSDVPGHKYFPLFQFELIINFVWVFIQFLENDSVFNIL